MENKKLLKYLLNDLSELDELFAGQGKNSFDEFEMEFIRSRISGSMRLVSLFMEKENNKEVESAEAIKENPAVKTPGVWIEETSTKAVPQEAKQENKIEEKTAEIFAEEKVVVVENNITAPEIVEEQKEVPTVDTVDEETEGSVHPQQHVAQNELQLEEDEPAEMHNKRLGDIFLKEKSVNDIRSDDMSKLEHKLSNRPVTSIQSAIGINDRFQYIRELFEGSTENFVKAVADLDSMNDMKDAVDYMQANFKWKKNEASLKFVNLIKRRFPNE
jgi:hypothetical protein